MPYYLYVALMDVISNYYIVPGISHFLCLSLADQCGHHNSCCDHYKGDPLMISISSPSLSEEEAAHQYMWLVMFLVHSPTTSQSLYLAAFCNFFFNPIFTQIQYYDARQYLM